MLLNAARFPAGANPCDRKPKRTQKQNQSSVRRLSRARSASPTQSSPNSIASHHSPGLPPTAPSRAYVSFSFIALEPRRTIARRAHTSPIDTPTFNDCQSRKFPPSHRASCLSLCTRSRRGRTRTSSINTHTHYTLHTRARATVVGARRRRACGYEAPHRRRPRGRKRKRRFLVPLAWVHQSGPGEIAKFGGVRAAFVIYVLGDLFD